MFKIVKIMTILSGLALLFLAPGGAAAYTETMNDTTLVFPYFQNGPSPGYGYTTWTDIVGDETVRTGNEWDIKRMAVTWSGANLEMQIYTNYPQAGISAAGVNAGQADIALGHNGVFDVGIKMSGTDLGNIYTVTSWIHPQDNPPLIWNDGGWIYAGLYDQANPKTPNVLIGTTGLNNWGTATVKWNTLPDGSDTTYMIDINFPTGFNTSGAWNSFNFEVGSGTCGNEVIAGIATNSGLSTNPAPIPASFVLLASGLLALLVLSRRKKAALVRGDKK